MPLPLSLALASPGRDVRLGRAHPAHCRRTGSGLGSPPFDVYAATETAGISSPCIHRNRHVYEDLLVIEPVDRDGNPVPPGNTGARLLVTVLFSRTLPLIRYEMSDTVWLGGRGCCCRRAFRLMEDIEGRTEDILHLPGKAGTVAAHPLVFHHVLDHAALTGWQVIQEPGRLRVLMVGHSHGNSQEGVRAARTTRPCGGRSHANSCGCEDRGPA